MKLIILALLSAPFLAAPELNATQDALGFIKQPLVDFDGGIRLVDVPFVISSSTPESTFSAIVKAHLPQQISYHELVDINVASLCGIGLSGLPARDRPAIEVRLDLENAQDGHLPIPQTTIPWKDAPFWRMIRSSVANDCVTFFNFEMLGRSIIFLWDHSRCESGRRLESSFAGIACRRDALPRSKDSCLLLFVNSCCWSRR